MLPAEITAEGWVLIISAFFTGISILATQLLTLWLEHKREQAKIERDRITAEKVDEVRTAAEVAALKAAEVKSVLAITTAKQERHLTDQDIKLDNVVTKVEEVHKATNSLTDRLVATTDLEAHARGVSEERARSMMDKQPPEVK